MNSVSNVYGCSYVHDFTSYTNLDNSLKFLSNPDASDPPPLMSLLHMFDEVGSVSKPNSPQNYSPEKMVEMGVKMPPPPTWWWGCGGGGGLLLRA
ncbi:unnamed protein product [Lactuca virosa]|uniref:Uncharacterized protein n=1 Tax=Lactuca virosa TaxID=75947 RepID=A0AAU9MTS6_9ASTR|nr:unnamed protein product [Lactuca virosa]CAH1450505.1 unnamed protein product [Lactuca virosa]